MSTEKDAGCGHCPESHTRSIAFDGGTRPLPCSLRACTSRRSGSERRRRGGGDQKSLLPNRLAAARARSWRRCRHGTTARQRGRFGLGTFWIDDSTSGSRRRIAVAALLARTVAVRTYDSRPPALAAPGGHEHGAKWFGSGRPGQPKRCGHGGHGGRGGHGGHGEPAAAWSRGHGGHGGRQRAQRVRAAAAARLPRHARQCQVTWIAA